MDNEFVRFITALSAGSFLRILLTVVLTSASVLTAYGAETGYHLLIPCNAVTVAGAFFLEYKNYRRRQQGK